MAEQTQADPMEALKVILAQLNESNREQMMEFARELKKPSEREQRKLDAEDAHFAKAQKERLNLAMADEQRRENRRKNCSHVSRHEGTGQSIHLWRAQTHTPLGVTPYIVPTCSNCFTQTPKIPATTDMLTNGVNLHKYPTLTYESLIQWSERAPYKA